MLVFTEPGLVDGKKMFTIGIILSDTDIKALKSELPISLDLKELGHSESVPVMIQNGGTDEDLQKLRRLMKRTFPDRKLVLKTRGKKPCT